jgi:hypothetical protein
MTTISLCLTSSPTTTTPWLAAFRMFILTVLLAAAIPSAAHADDKQLWEAAHAQSAVLYARIQKEFDAAGLIAAYPGLTIEADSRGAPVLRYRVRTWQVYRQGMMPEFGDSLSAEEGPLSTGLLLTFNAFPISEKMQQVITSGITVPAARAAAIDDPFVRQEPYWISYGCGVTIPERKLGFVVLTLFNHQTAKKLLDDVFQCITRALAIEKLGDLDP